MGGRSVGRVWKLEEGPSNGSRESEVVTSLTSLTDGATGTGFHQASLASFHLGAE